MSNFLAPALINGVAYLAPQTPPPDIVVEPPITVELGITLLPKTLTLQGGGTVKFTHIVSGPGDHTQSVVYVCSIGTVGQDGTYTAPDAIFLPQTATVTAVSLDDNTVFAFATVFIPARTQEQATPLPLRHYSHNVTNRYGVAVEGASIKVTDKATGQRATLYVDAQKTREVFNPLETDANGFFSFYVEAAQCSYTVSGKGIVTYTRNDIFDVVPTVDLTDIYATLQVLQLDKVAHVELEAALERVATLEAQVATLISNSN